MVGLFSVDAVNCVEAFHIGQNILMVIHNICLSFKGGWPQFKGKQLSYFHFSLPFQ